MSLVAKARFPLPEFTARELWCIFLTPELAARVDGFQKMHPSSRAVNSGSGNRAFVCNISET